ncbi:MAG: FAD-binding oxidoreductase [Proteobacteria bacterium]|nr:FAD-binding oxidoreductase [Pseudomonadota bacterium]
MNSGELTALFEQAIPLNRLMADEKTLAFYSRDMTENPSGRPDLVIKLHTSEEAEAVVRLAGAHRVPLIPRIAGTNLGGLSLAPQGGAILDLTEMNRILEIDEMNMIAVIEPGVTFQQLVDELENRDLPLTIGIPLSPPHTSVIANCLLDGLGNLSLVYGTMGEWIAGLEVILASGQVIRTGSWALSDIPYGRAPLPDLTGLFVSWQGTTGLVTKMAVELKPNPPLRKRLFILTYDRRTTYELMRRLARLRLFDDIGGLSWPTGKMLYGVEKPIERDPNEPEFYTYIDVSANSSKEMDVKLETLTEQLETVRQAQGTEIEKPFDIDTLCLVAPEFKKFAKFPTDLDFLTKNPGGGLTWVGTYGPMSRFERAADKGIEIMERHGFPPLIVSRPMKGGHFGVLRFIETFQRDDEREVEKVRQCNSELTDMVLEHGFIPYKTPAWSVKKLLPLMWPGTHDLMRSVRSLLDPLGIMNPGRWQLDPEEDA